MDTKTFLENFSVIADAPNGIQKLRKTILNLAIAGALSKEEAGDGEVFKQLLEVPDNEVGERLVFDSSHSDNYPANWVRASFRNIGRWVGGNGFPTAEQGNSLEKILFCKVSDMNREGNEVYVLSTAHTISEETAKRLRVTVHSKGTVVFPKIGGAIATNKRRIIVKPTAIDNNCMGVAPCSAIDSNWLYILFMSYDFVLYQTGTALPSLSQRILDQIEFGVPPLAEQQRIVAKVDEFMSLCDELEAAKDKRELFRTTARDSSIDAISTATTPEELSAAWSRISSNWELVSDSFDSISSLRTLLVDLSIQGQLFGRQELGEQGYPKKWDVSNFKELCDIEGGNQPPKSTFVAEPREGYVQLFQIRDLGSNPIPVFIPEEMAKSTAKEGDILIGRYGASVGKVFRAQDGAYNVALVKFIYPKDRLNPDFVFWLLKSTRSQALFTGMTRSAQAGFNKRDLAPLLIPIPSLEEQVRIVSRLNELMTICGDLEGRLKKRIEIESAFAHASSQLLTV